MSLSHSLSLRSNKHKTSTLNFLTETVDKRDASQKSSDLELHPSVGQGEVVLEINAGAEVKQYIGPLTMIAICFNICNSWAGVSGSMQVALLQGGPPTLLYGMLITTIVYMSIALTIGELASVYPTAGGQYHFASILAPKSLNRVISYTCGIVTAFSWIAIGAAVMMIPSTQILAVATYYYPTFEAKPWNYFVIYQSMGLLILAYNTFLLKKVPRTHDVGCTVSLSPIVQAWTLTSIFTVAFTIILFLATFITLLARSSPKATSDFVWKTFINETGWSDGVCFLNGLLTTCFIYAGLDASLHLAEEAPNPRKAVPRAAVLAVGVGFITAFLFSIALLYSISDFKSILAIEG